MPPPLIPILRHSRTDGAGYLTDSLGRNSLAYTIVDLFDRSGFTVPLDDAPALVVLGGSQSANDELDFLKQERRLIAEAVARNKPVLGICLGSQLMAQVLGEQVFRIAKPEIGFYAVRATAAAESDPLFKAWGEQTVFHWHSEGYAVPRGAQCLASSDGCPVQAFRYGDCHWGIQFHPEVTPAIIASWCEQDRACGSHRELQTPIDAQWDAGRLQTLAYSLFDRWARMVVEKF